MNNKITIEFDAEKLKALEKFTAKKNIDLKAELVKSLEKLYEKHVPAQVKEYLS